MTTAPRLFNESDGHFCRIMYHVGGLQYALQGLLNRISSICPLVRINVTYCVADSSAFISLGDTKQGKPLTTKFRYPGREAPIVMSQHLQQPLILNNLDELKSNPLYDDPLLIDVPFLSHSSLLRLPMISDGAYVLLFNFWSDQHDAFKEEDLAEFRLLALPVAEELYASLPDMYDDNMDKSLVQQLGGVAKLKMCAGLYPLLRQIEQVAPTDYTVLILGETGTGKEGVADAVYELSSRRNGPFIKVNCASIPETLLDSEMFGHEKGSFTGANTTKAGFFELANGGTIFLDEIGEMSLSAQVRLLRVLDRGIISRVGSALPITLNIRVIAATNANLPQKVREGTFRKDLWYRLAGYPVEVPPLRDRRGDIPALVNYFIRSKSEPQGHYSAISISDAQMNALYRHDWPGNVRELEHVVECALIQAGSKQELHFEPGNINLEPVEQQETLLSDWPSMAELENRYIRAVLKHCRGKMTGQDSASAVLGIHYTTLRAKMRQMGLPLPRDV